MTAEPDDESLDQFIGKLQGIVYGLQATA